jgi:predicted secreted hydrolase
MKHDLLGSKNMLITGTITINGTAYQVSGTAWKDHEFSTSELGKDALGWESN